MSSQGHARKYKLVGILLVVTGMLSVAWLQLMLNWPDFVGGYPAALMMLFTGHIYWLYSKHPSMPSDQVFHHQVAQLALGTVASLAMFVTDLPLTQLIVDAAPCFVMYAIGLHRVLTWSDEQSSHNGPVSASPAH